MAMTCRSSVIYKIAKRFACGDLLQQQLICAKYIWIL